MDYKILLAFSIGMIILAVSPGPGVLASVSTAVSKGFKASLVFITGLVVGDTLFFILALIGMSAISKVMGQLFYVIKMVGGIYLIYIGWDIIKHRKDEIVFDKNKSSKYKTFVSALLVTFGNPKPILFYASIVPTIIDITRINFYEIIAIICIISAISFIVIGSYCYLAIMSKSLLLKKKYQNKVNLASGMIMVSAGSYIMLKKG